MISITGCFGKNRSDNDNVIRIIAIDENSIKFSIGKDLVILASASETEEFVKIEKKEMPVISMSFDADHVNPYNVFRAVERDDGWYMISYDEDGAIDDEMKASIPNIISNSGEN